MQNCQENVLRSLAKGKLDEKNKWKFLIGQVRSYTLPYTSQIVEKSFFFRLPYLEYDFMIANIVRLNLAVLKMSKTSHDDASGGVLC